MSVSIEQWIEALESGEYPQTAGSLRDEEGFSCLGVLCDLFCEEDPYFPVYALVDREGSYEYGAAGETAVLPLEVVKWLGLLDQNPIVRLDSGDDDSKYESLTVLNDQGASFKELAAFIRNTFLEG